MRIPRPRAAPERRTARRAPELPAWFAPTALDILDDGWRAAVAGRLATVADDVVWKRTWWGRRRLRVDCAELADLADAFAAAKSAAHDAAGRSAALLVRRLGRSEPEQRLAEEMVKRLPLPGDEQIDALVHGLRIVGVYVCLVGGTGILPCPSLIALARGRARAEFAAALERRLDDLRPPSW